MAKNSCVYCNMSGKSGSVGREFISYFSHLCYFFQLKCTVFAVIVFHQHIFCIDAGNKN